MVNKNSSGIPRGALRYGQMLSLLGEGIPSSGYHSTNGCDHACIKGLGSGCNFFCGFGGHSFVHSHRAGQLFIFN